MRTIVLGAGVIGIATAHSLLESGHDVVVLEQHEAPALGTSYANAAQISPALSSPWATPGLTTKALRWLVQRFPPLVFGRVPDLRTISWLISMRRSADPERFRASTRAMVALGEYSRDLMRQMRERLPIDYDGRAGGTFVLFRSEKQQAGYRDHLDTLAAMDVPGHMIDLDTLATLEPNLAIADVGIAGAAHLPDDETGDCRLFTTRLADICAAAGARLEFSVRIREIVTEGGRAVVVRTDSGSYEADLVVCCLGTGAAAILDPLGIRLPIQPVKGYSLTIAADSDAVGPVSTVADETFKIGVTSLGGRIRVGGTAELAGYDLSRKPRRFAGLEHVVSSLFPRIPREAIAGAERWSGLRPMTPDGPPIIGRTAIGNLWVNGGHGTLGWTMACGAARVVTDLINGASPAVDTAAFSVERFRKGKDLEP